MYLTMKYSSDEEKEENLTSMLRCFSKTPCYWGIDKCKLQLHSNVIMDRQHLEYLHIKNPSEVDIKYDSQSNVSKIVVKNDAVGKITLCFFNNEPYKTDCQFFELINGGINVATTGIEGLKQRLKNAVTLLKDKYKISLTSLDAIIKEIELACTLALDTVPHLQTRRLLVESFANDKTVNFATHNSSNGNYSIVSSKKSKHKSAVLYDKNVKAIANKQINPNDERLRDFQVQRLEIKLTHRKIKEILKDNRLNELKDENVIEAIENESIIAYFNFIDRIKESINSTEKIITSSKKCYRRSQDYAIALTQHSNDIGVSSLKSTILDEEILVLAPFTSLGKHRADVKRRILEILQRKEKFTDEIDYYGVMVTWQFIQLFREMVHSIEGAKSQGLGCIKNPNSSLVHKIHLKTYSSDLRNKVFENIISNTKRKTLKDSNFITKLFLKKLLCEDNDRFVEKQYILDK